MPDVVKLGAMLVLIAILGIVFGGAVVQLTEKAVETRAAYRTYIDYDYSEQGTGRSIPNATAPQVARTFLLDPLFGDKWASLTTMISVTVVSFVSGWMLYKLVRAVMA